MSRVSFDNEKDLVPPQESPHWKALPHEPQDVCIATLQDLCLHFRQDLSQLRKTTTNEEEPQTTTTTSLRLAVWSCVFGYVESLATTNKKGARHRIFPIPFRALERLVHTEFPALITSTSTTAATSGNTHHRQRICALATTIWSHVACQTSLQGREEWHANSVYTLLRGAGLMMQKQKKSLDCFGAALVTILACGVVVSECNNNNNNNDTKSFLTLSEDHAYERHCSMINDDEPIWSTCEVAVPGNTKAAQAKRGRSIHETVASATATATTTGMLTPETSWLYMAAHPVVCDSPDMVLVAMAGNINCSIDKTQRGVFSSGQLYDFKREVLWELYHFGSMKKFPFGLMELGDCEEHRCSHRSMEWVHDPDVPEEPILRNEQLFLEAIRINRRIYHDAQCYPYLYAGHYHKDAGNEGPEHEYRLVHAMKYYADAARVASQYRYQGQDAVQLNKHMTSVALLMAEDILTPKYTIGIKVVRPWKEQTNAIAVTTWLFAFFDSLCYWEEESGAKNFVEILSSSHKHSISKLFQLIPLDIRQLAVKRVTEPGLAASPTASQEEKNMKGPPFFCQMPRSKRMGNSKSLLVRALTKPRVSVHEMELTIPTSAMHDGDGNVCRGGQRTSKRARRVGRANCGRVKRVYGGQRTSKRARRVGRANCGRVKRV